MKQYEAYKESGLDWLDVIPNHWTSAQMKRLFSFGKGLSITKADLVDDGQSVISYGQVHAKNNPGTRVEDHLLRYVPVAIAENNPSSAVSKGDFIFADTSEDLDGCGNCAYIDRDGIFAGYHSVIARSERKDNKYFAYLFLTDAWRSQLRSSVGGVKVFSITQSILGQTSIIIPSEEEQEVIAAYLDLKVGQIDAIISEKEAMVEQLQQYRKSLISEVVTRGLDPNVPMKDSGIDWIGKIPAHWQVVKLKYTGSFDNGLTYSPNDVVDNGILVLRSSNIQNQKLAFEDNVYVKNAPEDLLVRPGDIIICSRNGSANLVGKCAYVDEIENTSFGAFMMRYRPSIHGKYAFYAFQSATDSYKGLYSTSTINQLTKGVIDQMYIVVPTMAEQEEIAIRLDSDLVKIDESVSELQSQIEDLRAYKSSVITEAVTGKVDLREWTPAKATT